MICTYVKPEWIKSDVDHSFKEEIPKLSKRVYGVDVTTVSELANLCRNDYYNNRKSTNPKAIEVFRFLLRLPGREQSEFDALMFLWFKMESQYQQYETMQIMTHYLFEKRNIKSLFQIPGIPLKHYEYFSNFMVRGFLKYVMFEFDGGCFWIPIFAHQTLSTTRLLEIYGPASIRIFHGFLNTMVCYIERFGYPKHPHYWLMLLNCFRPLSFDHMSVVLIELLLCKLAENKPKVIPSNLEKWLAYLSCV